VVLDESHRVKNHLQKDVNGTKTYKTQRVKASYELSQRVPSDGFILLVTGTPVVNRPIELASQLDIMRRLDEFGGFMGFAKRYCGAYHDAYGWDFGGATNLDELNEMLRSRCYIRRLKADVLSELPPKVWADVIIDEFDPGAMAEYRTAEADTIAYLGARAAQIAAENGLDPESAKVEALLRAESAEHLVRITALCKLAARAKMPAVRAWVEDFLESGQKLVVFAHHREIVDALATQFGADKIQGGISDTARQAAADRFQNDPQCRIIVCSIKAGGESITLTSASNVLFVEQTWTPAEMDQASDRCHRMGQRDSVTAWNAIGSGTIDEDRAQLIASKRVVVSAATEGGKAATQKHSSEADLIVKLAKRGLQAAAAA
jgi:SNF2 family DNA or RNA helicase